MHDVHRAVPADDVGGVGGEHRPAQGVGQCLGRCDGLARRNHGGAGGDQDDGVVGAVQPVRFRRRLLVVGDLLGGRRPELAEPGADFGCELGWGELAVAGPEVLAVPVGVGGEPGVQEGQQERGADQVIGAGVGRPALGRGREEGPRADRDALRVVDAQVDAFLRGEAELGRVPHPEPHRDLAAAQPGSQAQLGQLAQVDPVPLVTRGQGDRDDRVRRHAQPRQGLVPHVEPRHGLGDRVTGPGLAAADRGLDVEGGGLPLRGQRAGGQIPGVDPGPWRQAQRPPGGPGLVLLELVESVAAGLDPRDEVPEDVGVLLELDRHLQVPEGVGQRAASPGQARHRHAAGAHQVEQLAGHRRVRQGVAQQGCAAGAGLDQPGDRVAALPAGGRVGAGQLGRDLLVQDLQFLRVEPQAEQQAAGQVLAGDVQRLAGDCGGVQLLNRRDVAGRALGQGLVVDQGVRDHHPLG